MSVGVVLLTAAALWLREEEAAHPAPRRPAPEQSKSRNWSELEAPVVTPDAANDGDSFLLRHRGGTHTLRLYFVDCPEKRRHQFNRPRLAEQGAYFGGLAESDTLELGQQAREFTLGRLTEGNFRVFTRWEPVYGDRRHYAHVEIRQPDGSWRQLAELLVEQGLARIHTKGDDLPEGLRRAVFAQRLREVEKQARLARRGGWAFGPEGNE